MQREKFGAKRNEALAALHAGATGAVRSAAHAPQHAAGFSPVSSPNRQLAGELDEQDAPA